MKNIFKKENLMPVVVLGAICLVVAALLGVVNAITGPIIQKAEEQKAYDSLREVLDGEFEPVDIPAGAPSTVTAVYKVSENGSFIGHVVTVAKQGYASKLLLTVGIDSDGKTTKVVITSQQETHGKDINPLLEGLSAGITSEQVGDVEHVANATKTSDYIKEAVADAFKAVGFSDGSSGGDDEEDGGDENQETLPKTDDEIKAIATEMLDGVTLTDITLDNAPSALKRAYGAGESGYFLYIVVPGAYVPVATEAVVHLNSACEIVKVNLLSWIVGHGVEPGDFANGFVGANKDTAGDVELVTGATGTSVDFRDAVEAAVATIADGNEAKETLLVKRMEKLVPSAKGFEKLSLAENAPATLKALYKVVGFDGYVAYVITSTKYVDVETEALVYINAGREVGNVELITWTVGHGVEPGDFAASLKGKGVEELADIELVTSATVTAGNLRDAVADAISYTPENNNPFILGIVATALSVVAVAAVIIIKRRRRA